jgi:hypothetical protein
MAAMCNSMMNWYFEKDGVSQGPLSEENLAAKVRNQDVPVGGLIWHTGLEEWKSVAELRPAWLQTVPAAPAPAAPAPASPAPASPAPVLETKATAVGPADKAVKPVKVGFLKRLFGFGR